jgi:endonuclease III
MTSPKSKNSSTPKNELLPGRRDGANAKPRARPVRSHSLYSPAEVHEIFRRFSVQRPEPKGELEHVNAFTLLVAVVLSAQATDVGVNKATRRLFLVADTPHKMLALGEAGVVGYIQTIGLFRMKAKNLLETCRLLVERHGGEVPRTREALQALPGVGRKTANVVLNVAFGEATMAVDTHVFRVANRTGLAPGKDPLEVESRLLQRVPAEYLVDAHHWLILHGRYVCRALKPLCFECAVAAYCDYRPKTPPPLRR